jgi:signal transduction histidine kinase
MDISQRKRAEEEREHLLTREHEARAAAELANQTKDEFLAIVSHELRTPLNAIVGWAGMLRSGKLADNQVSQAIEIIDRNAKVQAQLIEDILDVARIVSGKPRLDLRPVNLQQVVQSAVDSTQPAADEKNISLQLGIDSKAKPVLGDSARLEQIVWNLLTNSVKFTPAGGHINVDLISADSEVRIVVRDTGQGIAPEFLPHVFDRFRQADTSSTRRQGGLGLGLAIVHQLVELHGGTVEAFSAGEGKGATFTVEFPCIGSGSEISLDEGNLTEVMPSGQVASPGR